MSARLDGGLPTGSRRSRGRTPEGLRGLEARQRAARADEPRRRGSEMRTRHGRPETPAATKLKAVRRLATAVFRATERGSVRNDAWWRRVRPRELDRTGGQHLRTTGSQQRPSANAVRAGDARWQESGLVVVQSGAGEARLALERDVWDVNAAAASANARAGPWFPAMRAAVTKQRRDGLWGTEVRVHVETPTCSTTRGLPASTVQSDASAAASDELRSLLVRAGPEPRAASAASGKPRPSLAPRRTRWARRAQTTVKDERTRAVPWAARPSGSVLDGRRARRRLRVSEGRRQIWDAPRSDASVCRLWESRWNAPSGRELSLTPAGWVAV